MHLLIKQNELDTNECDTSASGTDRLEGGVRGGETDKHGRSNATSLILSEALLDRD